MGLYNKHGQKVYNRELFDLLAIAARVEVKVDNWRLFLPKDVNSLILGYLLFEPSAAEIKEHLPAAINEMTRLVKRSPSIYKFITTFYKDKMDILDNFLNNTASADNIEITINAYKTYNEIIHDLAHVEDNKNISFLLYVIRNATDVSSAQTIAALLEHEADPNFCYLDRYTPLSTQAQKSTPESVAIARLLLNYGAKIDFQSELSNSSQNSKCLSPTALMEAARVGNFELVKLFIESGANLNLQDYSGFTALHYALNHKHFDIAKLIIEKGANINIQAVSNDPHVDYHSFTCVHLVVLSKDTALLTFILAYQPDLTIKDTFGRTALDIATEEKNTEMVEILHAAMNNATQSTVLFAAPSPITTSSPNLSPTITPGNKPDNN